MRLAGLLAGLAAASPACGTTSHAGFVLVTVDARPAVHDAASITVTLANAGTMRTDTLMLGGKSFPVTFSISSPGRTGDLAIAVDASDAGGIVIGHGSAMTTVAVASAEVMLDPTDFVVNTDYAMDQFPTDDPESSGFQLAALPDGTWTAVFRDSCMQSACNVFARRFTADGKPVTTQAAASTNAFVVTARPSDLLTVPAVVSNQTATVAVWNFTDQAPSTAFGVACRTISADGVLGADQVSIASDSVFAAMTVAALASGDFVASWSAFPATGSGLVIHSAFIKSDCSSPGGMRTVSMEPDGAVAERNAVASSGDQVLFTWVIGGDLHARTATSTGTLAPVQTLLIQQTMTYEVSEARLAAMSSGGFVLAVRWGAKTSSTAPGKIELYQLSATGVLTGTPVLVTDQSGNSGDEGFGFASGRDSTVMVAWHVCNSSGDACTVSGRILKLASDPRSDPWATPVTDAFTIPTTTGGSDKRASVVGLPDAFAVVWSDSSMKPPDTSGQAVRARIIYPPGS